MSDPQRWLRTQAGQCPEADAILHGDDRISFAALDRMVEDAARTLADIPQAVQTHLHGDPLETLVLALAAPRAGLAFHPLSSLRAQAPDGMAWRERLHRGELPPEAVQLIISTSGSSCGTPKAAMLTGGNLAAAVTASSQGLRLYPGDSWLCCLPLSAIGGLSIPFRCIEAGAQVILTDGFDPARIGHLLKTAAVSHLSLVPAMLSRLLETDIRPTCHLKAVLVGGAALSLPLAERAIESGWPIRPTYGLSETASQVATCKDGECWQPGLAGMPLPGFEIDFTAKGRVRLRGPQVMAGYANPGLEPGLGLDRDGWLETGDMGWQDSTGQLWVSGRADDVLISAGVTLHPSEIESLLSECPELGEIAVSARPDDVWGDVPVLFHTGPARADSILDWCHRHLPGCMRPRQVVRLDQLPHNGAGKLDRRALRAAATALPV